MFEYLKSLISPKEELNTENDNRVEDCDKKKIPVATCALLVEMAKADGEISEDERKKIISLMRETFNLEDECVNELIELSEEKIKESISLYEFTSIINDEFTIEEKFELLKNLWKLIYVDEKLNMYEDHLVKKIGGMIGVDHKKIIQAKLIVKEEMNL